MSAQQVEGGAWQITCDHMGCWRTAAGKGWENAAASPRLARQVATQSGWTSGSVGLTQYGVGADWCPAHRPAPRWTDCPACAGNGRSWRVGGAGGGHWVDCADCHGSGRLLLDPLDAVSIRNRRPGDAP